MFTRATAVLFAVLLLLVGSALPSRALAMRGTTISLSMDKMEKGDDLWFGRTNVTMDGDNYNGPIPWTVLDADHDNTGAAGKLFISKYILDRRSYAAGVDTQWVNSGLRTWLNLTFAADVNHFTLWDLNVFAVTTKASSGAAVDGDALVGDRLFLLSDEEAANTAYFSTAGNRIAYSITKQTAAKNWHMRTITGDAALKHTRYAEAGTGIMQEGSLSDTMNVRPAFNMRLSQVLFIAAASGGKYCGPVGPNALMKNNDTAGLTQWKATLINLAMADFNVSPGNVYVTTAGGTVTVRYRAATTGGNDYVSALLIGGGGASAEALYYGRLKNVDDFSMMDGSVDIVIPTGLTAGDVYSLAMINEEYNGGTKDDTKLTDYSSPFRYVTLHVTQAESANAVATGDEQTPWFWFATGLTAVLATVCLALFNKRRTRFGRN